MNTSMKTPRAPYFLKIGFLALGCVLCAALSQTSDLKAADTGTFRSLDDMAVLPVTTSFEKVADAERGPYVLNVKNTSKDSILVSVKVLLSVADHAEAKARVITDHAIDADQVWSIADLSAGDRVTLTAKGFAPLEITVP
jgi:hypothetical protein